MDENRDILNEIVERLVHIEGKIDRIERTVGSEEAEKEITYLKSYSQNGEDVIIYHLFRKLGIEKPSYIDIGAHHPYKISNTALFYEVGGRGINIEANPNLFEAFQRERPEDINLCCGIGPQRGIMPFYMIDNWSGRNSFVKENVDLFVQENPEFSVQEVLNIEIKTLDEVVLEYNMGGIADYMSIDIEGMEYEVLQSFDLMNRGPKVLTLEVMKNDQDKAKKLEQLLDQAGYSMWCRTGTNYTFIKEHLYGGKI